MISKSLCTVSGASKIFAVATESLRDAKNKDSLLSAAIAASHRFNRYQTPISPFSSIINQLDFKNVNYIGILINRKTSIRIKILKELSKYKAALLTIFHF